MISPQEPAAAPEAFREALSGLGRATFRENLCIREIPTPSRLAPYGTSLAASITDPADPDQELAIGRFVMLYDPAAPSAWGGEFRVVTFIRASVEEDVASEGLLSSVAWDWLLEALERQQAHYSHHGGTLTRSFSQGFGTLEHHDEHVRIELRASWTPQGPEARLHLQAWAEMVCTYAGLPPLPDDVARFPRSGTSH